MRLGAPIVDQPKDPEELAREHVRLGYRAGFCPWALTMDDPDYLRQLREAFDRQNVIIAEVIGWRNLLPEDDSMRTKAFEWVAEQLAVAEELNARCCVSFGGTRDNVTSWTPHPENLTEATFDLIVETVRKLIDAVRPRRTKLALEMMASAYPDSIDSYLRLIEAVDRPAFAVHLDPVNIILTRQDYFNNGVLIRDCIKKLGPWIASCHAKDITWLPERGFHFAESIPGTGTLDFQTYLRELRKLPPDLPLLLEHLRTTEEYQQGLHYIQSIEAETH